MHLAPGSDRAGDHEPRPNYLPWAVLCSVSLIGIVALRYCWVANRRFAAGDVPGGMHAAQRAKTWCWISFVAGLTMVLLFIAA